MEQGRTSPGQAGLTDAVQCRLLPLLFLLLGCLLWQSLLAPPALAASHLARFLKRVPASEIFPGADHIGEPKGDPPVAEAFRGGEPIGYVFLNSDFVSAIGYSGKPIHVLLALDPEGVLVGAKLVDHHEPIVLIGIPEQKITAVIDGYLGLDIGEVARADHSDRDIDIVSGATVTIMVIDDSILRAGIKVARRFSLAGLTPEASRDTGPKAEIDMSQKSVESWETLLGDGSVRRLSLSIGDINRAFEESGDLVAAQRAESGPETDAFIDLHAALVSVPSVGISLLGAAEHANLEKRLEPGQQAILLASSGRYSFKGSGYVRGGIFDRFQVIQGDNAYRFRDRDHKRLRRVAAEGAPDFADVDLFRIPKGQSLDPTKPWRVELLVSRETGPTDKAFLTFALDYRLPDRFLLIEAVEEPDAASVVSVEEAPPLWQTLWRDKAWQVVVLGVALSILTLIFFLQTWLVHRPRLTDGIRLGFLVFTLFGLGFYANAQLSVVNTMTFSNALISGFSWDYFLMEPLIFILWFSVAASLLFWGRGAFCGWLCPFGALQELTNRLAKLARVPQIAVPWWLHERLWPLKYMIFLLLFGLSLYSLEFAERLAEVEPFKTVIILKFAREWPYVVFALTLLAAGLFIERFYCRYLCPLGAALALPGRLRMFEWLKRYRECGAPCQRCAKDCMVQAIHPEGHINPNECLYCLHCQTLYQDDHRCPVMIQRRLKRERRAALSSKTLPPKTLPPKTLPATAGAANAPKTLADFMPD